MASKTETGGKAKGVGNDGVAVPVTIKKYANRRLYNTATSSYVTLDHLCQMVKDEIDFVVYDAKSGEDITRAVLTQIIVEEESKGQNLLPIGFLRQLIGFYGNNMQQMLVPPYLEATMQSFSKNQEKMKEMMEGTFGTVFPFAPLEEMSKQNLAMFERAFQFFNPYAESEGGDPAHPQTGGSAVPPSADTAGTSDEPDAGNAEMLEELRKQVETMQQQLAAMGKDQSGKS